jgi:hypothetical protein
MNSIQKEINKVSETETSKKNIEVWEDLVNIKDLVISLIICSTTALGGYFLAPNKPPKPLLYGLFGSIFGFVICSFILKPKRVFLEND